jgi:hypothetical protein
MIRSTVLSACVLGCFAIAQAQPLNVHQQKQPAATATAQVTTATMDKKAPNTQMAEMVTQGKIHCPAGVHYFVGYNPCIAPSPWDQPQQR